MEESAARPTILVVDDAPDILMIIESILGKHYSLKLFNDSQQALDYAFANPPDLILLDIMMPNIDGLEACRRLKANPRLTDVPVIFISAKNEDEYEEYSFSVGASDFIHKPISAPIVSARVKTHIKIKFLLDFLKAENTSLQQNAQQIAILREFIWGGAYTKR